MSEPLAGSTDGCYKSVAFIRYDKAAVTDADVAKADAIQRNRTCDAECYTEAVSQVPIL